MLSMRIEIQPHLIERTGKKTTLTRRSLRKEKRSIEARSEKRRKK